MFVVDFYGYNVENVDASLIKRRLLEEQEDTKNRRFISVMVALVISDQPGETLLLGNNIGERVNWTIQNSKYVLFHWKNKLMVRALSVESIRQLMIAYKSELDSMELFISLSNIAIRVPSGRRIAQGPATPNSARVEELPQIPQSAVASVDRSEEKVTKHPVLKHPVSALVPPNPYSSLVGLKHPVSKKIGYFGIFCSWCGINLRAYLGNAG